MGDKFVWCVKNGELNQVDECLSKGQDVNAEINGRCALHYAADYGHKDVIDFLLTKGAKKTINTPDKFGITPLLAAIYEGHTECVKVLLDQGANKTGTAPSGESYLNCAGKEDIKALLK